MSYARFMSYELILVKKPLEKVLHFLGSRPLALLVAASNVLKSRKFDASAVASIALTANP